MVMGKARIPNTVAFVQHVIADRRKELIGASHDVAEIQRYLGADTLGYLSLEGMLKAAGNDPNHFCHACFTGQYKVGFEQPDASQLKLFDS